MLCQLKHDIYRNMYGKLLPCMPLEIVRTTFEKGNSKLIFNANEWLKSAVDIFGHLNYDLTKAVSNDLAQDLTERKIYSSLQFAAYAFPNINGISLKIQNFRCLLEYLNLFNQENHPRYTPYGIKYLQRSIQKYPICQEVIDQFIDFFIENSSDLAIKAMKTFQSSLVKKN